MNKIFEEDIFLENDRALLRPLKFSDSEFLEKFSLEQPDLWKFSLVSAAGIENLKQYIDLAISGKMLHKEYPFIVFDKQSNGYAGSTRFYDIQLVNSSLQLGYTWYGKEFHGTGLNENCKYLLLNYAFETLKMERVEFRADNANKRSVAAMKKIGCIEEGILRNHLPKVGGGRRDSIVLSILKNEWEGGVKQRLLEML